MCEAVGLPVEKLIRVALGPLKLGKLPVGAWRDLTPEEVMRLRAAVARPSARRPTTPATRGGRRSVGGGRGETRRPDPKGSGSSRAATSPRARTRRT